MDLNVSLTDDLLRFVEAKVATGRFASSSEVVRESLGLMEAAERRIDDDLEWLRIAWADGIDSGDAGELDFAALKAEARAEMVKRTA